MLFRLFCYRHNEGLAFVFTEKVLLDDSQKMERVLRWLHNAHSTENIVFDWHLIAVECLTLPIIHGCACITLDMIFFRIGNKKIFFRWLCRLLGGLMASFVIFEENNKYIYLMVSNLRFFLQIIWFLKKGNIIHNYNFKFMRFEPST